MALLTVQVWDATVPSVIQMPDDAPAITLAVLLEKMSFARRSLTWQPPLAISFITGLRESNPIDIPDSIREVVMATSGVPAGNHRR